MIINKYQMTFFSVLLSILVTGLMLLGYHFWQKPQYPIKPVAVVELQTVVKEFVSNLAEQGITEAQQKQAVKQFSLKLEKELSELAKRHDIVIMSKAAVITGAPNLTSYLQGELGAVND